MITLSAPWTFENSCWQSNEVARDLCRCRLGLFHRQKECEISKLSWLESLCIFWVRPLQLARHRERSLCRFGTFLSFLKMKIKKSFHIYNLEGISCFLHICRTQPFGIPAAIWTPTRNSAKSNTIFTAIFARKLYCKQRQALHNMKLFLAGEQTMYVRKSNLLVNWSETLPGIVTENSRALWHDWLLGQSM